MPNVVKVAVSLTSTIFDSVEKERRKRGESRSEFFRQAVQAFLHDLQQRKAVERYVKGYIDHPEKAEEVDAISSASYKALPKSPGIETLREAMRRQSRLPWSRYLNLTSKSALGSFDGQCNTT